MKKEKSNSPPPKRPENTAVTKLPTKDPNNVEAKKYYIFNETGNIMISSTIEPDKPIEEEVQKIFAEVSVFFAGMTRAITTTINPNTKKPYTIYNYDALEKIIGGSGLFIQVTEEDMWYTSSSAGADFSKEMVEALLGLATGAGELSFATAMISSIGKQGLNVSASAEGSARKVGNIVFVCEYLLGMPIVSAIVVNIDAVDFTETINVGPCFKETATTTDWKLHKDTFLFVTPSFIREYAGDLDSIESDPNYVQLINWLQGLIKRTPTVYGVYDVAQPKVKISSGNLDPANTYQITGDFFPDAAGKLKFRDGTGVVNAGDWSSTIIKFNVSGSQSEASLIDIIDKNDKLVTSTPGAYSILEEPPKVTGVYDKASPSTKLPSGALDTSKHYQLKGENFTDDKGSLSFKGGSGTIIIENWSSGSIDFKVSGTQSTEKKIEIKGKDQTFTISTNNTFSIK